MAARSRAADTLLAAALVLLLAQAHGRSLQEDLVAPAPTADAAPAPAPAPLDGVSVDTGLMALDGVWPLDEIDPCWDDFNNCDSTNCFEYSAYSRNADPVAYNNCLNDCKAPYNACYPKQEKCTPPFELCKATLCSAASLDPGPQPQPPAGGFNSTEQMSAYVDAVQAWAFKVTLLPATTAACVDTCMCINNNCRQYQYDNRANPASTVQPWATFAPTCCTVPGTAGCPWG